MPTTSPANRCPPALWPVGPSRLDEPIRARPITQGPDRVMPWSRPAQTTARPDPRRRFRWLARRTRRGTGWMLVVSLVIGLGGALVLGATAPAAAQPAPTPPPTTTTIPTTPSTPVTCVPGSPHYDECIHSSAPATPAPCTGPGCIPQPTTSAPPPTAAPTGQPGDVGSGDGDCGITNIGGCVTNAINAFFRGIVTDALNPLLKLLSGTC